MLPTFEGFLRAQPAASLLRKPKDSSTALSSTLKMRKIVVSDPDATRVRLSPDFKVWEFNGWMDAINDVLADDEALLRRGGTPYRFVHRVLTSNPVPDPVL